MKLMKNTLLASILLAGFMNSATAASVTFDYVGNDFNAFTSFDIFTNVVSATSTLPSNLGPKISGSATFANGIDNPVTNYMLTDGKNSLDNTMALNANFSMTFNNNNVDIWTITISNFENNVFTSLFTTGDSFNIGSGTDQSIYSATINEQLFASDFANVVGLSGTWTLREEQVSAIPVPAALPLMASALGLFSFGSMRRKSS